jgi:hypothetical protein
MVQCVYAKNRKGPLVFLHRVFHLVAQRRDQHRRLHVPPRPLLHIQRSYPNNLLSLLHYFNSCIYWVWNPFPKASYIAPYAEFLDPNDSEKRPLTLPETTYHVHTDVLRNGLLFRNPSGVLHSLPFPE